MNSIIANIKSLLTGQPVEEQEDEPKRNPYPNGPATYKTMTNGQVRRMQARARRRIEDRGFKQQRRNYINREAERAVLRSMLQVLGWIDYATPQPSPSVSRVGRATKWCQDNYGSITDAVARYERLSGEKISA